MLLPREILAVTAACLTACFPLNAQNDDALESDMLAFVELDAFQVFSTDIKIVDGITGKDYEGEHPVVLGFRRDINEILQNFHKQLLLAEFKRIMIMLKTNGPYIQDLSALSQSFGFGPVEAEAPTMSREIAILKRMATDPFFKFKSLVVWDVARLEANGRQLPRNKYAKDIRYNEETGQWERRVMTVWRVLLGNGSTEKEQGLNLDTNEGFHYMERGIPTYPDTSSFKDADLHYPIFINNGVLAPTHQLYLRETLKENLHHIYDPFSWVIRGNLRSRGGFDSEARETVAGKSLPLTDRDWFDRLFGSFLNDVITIKYWGADEIYDYEIVRRDPHNKERLGTNIDFLNWQKSEKRGRNYDLSRSLAVPNIRFGGIYGSRFVMIDAYRRYGDAFLDALRRRLLNIEGETKGKDIILAAIEEASKAPSRLYLPAAAKAQEDELARYAKIRYPEWEAPNESD